jgi:hypothetical protein
VAKAIADHAFVVSEMPIILSMEMHCTPEQQAKIARDLITCLGDSLLSVRCAPYHTLPCAPLSPRLNARLCEEKGTAV